jgi:hypothetical protein
MLLVCLAGLLTANAGWAENSLRASLRGLAGVRVEVVLDEGNGTGAAAEKVLTKDLQLVSAPIQAETELRLRQAGMSILPADRDSGPTLFLGVSAAGRSAVLVSIHLVEWATVNRGSLSFRTAVISWASPMLIQAPEASTVREQIRDGVSAFLNQWLADRGK